MSDDSVFLDTNILVYANDAGVEGKRRIARSLIAGTLRSGTGHLSSQVLAEFWVTVTRKLSTPLERGVAERELALFSAFTILPVDQGTVLKAVQIQERHGISYWDAQVVSAASLAGCGLLYTEDLKDGGEYEGVRVVNPFRDLAPARD